MTAATEMQGIPLSAPVEEKGIHTSGSLEEKGVHSSGVTEKDGTRSPDDTEVSFEIDKKVERSYLWKLDTRLIPLLSFMYLLWYAKYLGLHLFPTNAIKLHGQVQYR
jgi:hypothetical protein